MSTATKEVQAAADRLRSERRPFVAATVVRAERPTSAKAGDTALVLDDGTIMGFVGGECAQASVQVQARAALETGEPVLLRISPDAVEPGSEALGVEAGAVTVHNPCLSGGSLEIFLEPEVPPPLLMIHGDAPIARAVSELAEWMGYELRPSDGALTDEIDAVVVATHGGAELHILRAALEAKVAYIGLVASTKRGAAVLDALGLDEEDRSRIATPAGLDIGSRTPQEVAVSILGEAIQRRSRRKRQPVASGVAHTADASASVAIDPVCGMAVSMVSGSRRLEHEGDVHWFCGSGCEQAFRADPAAFVGP